MPHERKHTIHRENPSALLRALQRDVAAPRRSDGQVTGDDLQVFAAKVRAECDAALKRLAIVDAKMLPPALRAMYEEQRARWCELRARADGDLADLQEAACAHLGRELTAAAVRALLRPH